MIDASAFTFSEPELLSDLAAKVVDVPHSYTTKSSIITHLAKSLAAPDYFGANWDALDECLRDLGWLEERLVVIRHDGVPRLPVDVLRVYLDVLARAVQSWRGQNEHEVVVTFPLTAREEIMTVAKEPVASLDRKRRR
jgi:hypothetical protein